MTSSIINIGEREIRENEPQTSVSNRVIYVPSISDPTTDQLMRIVEVSGAFDFWDSPEEDIYSVEDGEPV